MFLTDHVLSQILSRAMFPLLPTLMQSPDKFFLVKIAFSSHILAWRYNLQILHALFSLHQIIFISYLVTQLFQTIQNLKITKATILVIVTQSSPSMKECWTLLFSLPHFAVQAALQSSQRDVSPLHGSGLQLLSTISDNFL